MCGEREREEGVCACLPGDGGQIKSSVVSRGPLHFPFLLKGVGDRVKQNFENGSRSQP